MGQDFTDYFAYGSNMSSEQMRTRCPGATPVGQAVLHGYAFLINDRGVATIEPEQDSTVRGVVWRIGPADEAKLDRFEGVATNAYRKHRVEVQSLDGTVIKALVYRATRMLPGPPRPGYLERIISGARAFGCPEDYIAQLSKWQNRR